MNRSLWLVIAMLSTFGCSFDETGRAETPSVDPVDPHDPGGDDSPTPTLARLTIDAPGTWVLDTDMLRLTDPDGAIALAVIRVEEACDGSDLALVIADKIHVAEGATLRVRGGLPAQLWARTSIVVRGAIDASSDADGAGAGAQPVACLDAAPSPGLTSPLGGGGGGGGARFGAGGKGGKGKETDKASGGVAPMVVSVVPRGGCEGAPGGDGDIPSAAGRGGRGGGALWLDAGTAVEIYGAIDVGGEGGGAGIGRGGGGGGGSGGGLRIDAPVLAVHSGGVLAANGGGGGEGGDPQLVAAGDPGDDALPGDERARGGKGLAAKGGDGGDAGFGGGIDGKDGRDSDVGGGGGGGAGTIYIAVETLIVEDGAIVSPAAMQ